MNKAIYFLIYIFLTILITNILVHKIFYKEDIREKKPIISYEVKDIVSYKEIDGYEVIESLVKINEHEYLKTETTQHRTVIYRHLDTCSCGNYEPCSFSNKDSFNTKLDDKLNYLKKSYKK